jgi:hypothetical protein
MLRYRLGEDHGRSELLKGGGGDGDGTQLPDGCQQLLDDQIFTHFFYFPGPALIIGACGAGVNIFF